MLTVFETAKSLAVTSVQTLKAGKLYAPPEVQDERRVKCFSCPELLDTLKCDKCKCNVLSKTAVSGASCPLKKW